MFAIMLLQVYESTYEGEYLHLSVNYLNMVYAFNFKKLHLHKNEEIF